MFDDDEQEAYPDWGPVFLSAASKAMLLNWYRKAQKLRAAKRNIRQAKGAPRKMDSFVIGQSFRSKKDRQLKEISDDEGDDPMFSWLQEGLKEVTPASKAIAVRWMRSARARLQQKRGKGLSMTEADRLESAAAEGENFKSGRKSRMARK
jgi:hypothetical protein